MVIRHQIIIILLFPVLTLLWLTGWVLFCRESRSQEKLETVEKSMAITGIVFEEYDEPKHRIPQSKVDSSASL